MLKLTDEQRSELPRWLRNFPCEDEFGNRQLTRKEWEAEVCWRLKINPATHKPKRIANSFSEMTLVENAELLDAYRESLPPGDERDRVSRQIEVMDNTLATLRADNEVRRLRMAEVRAARKTPAGRPPIYLRVTTPNGHSRGVFGYEEAAELIGCSAASLTVRMSQAIKKTGRALVTVGLASRADSMWSVEKLHPDGTPFAVVQEPCQKPENDAGEKNETS